MNFIISIMRTLFRHKWLILIGTLLVTAFVYYYTRHMRGGYQVDATLYTGIVSGYTIENERGTDWGTVQNSMDNLISIMQAESTLRRVSLHLFARVLIKGSATEDRDGITQGCYLSTYNHLKSSPDGERLISLIDKQSEEKTVANFEKYSQPVKGNYIYELFYYYHPYYSYNALKNINVKRRLTSDLLDISYTSGDPGIAYNTVSILMEEFVNEYRRIRYGETDKVIEYFKSELARIGHMLNAKEDSLTKYNIDKRIINYDDETKEIAAINKEFELREQDALFAYNSSKAMLVELEKHMDSNAKQILNNLKFINKLKEASNLTGNISEIESSNNTRKAEELQASKENLSKVRQELSDLSSEYIQHQHSKEGISRTNIIEQWLDQTLLFEKAKAELEVVQQYRQELNDRYVFFAPVGTTIKQQERSINFIEQSYLNVLKSYNDALMRKKNLEMTSATLKVLNEPFYPISPTSTNRKKIVMGACAASFLFIIAILVLIEILDRTLRDAQRSRRVTGYNVLGAIPKVPSVPSRYASTYKEKAVQELSNGILTTFNERTKNGIYIVNLLSTTNHSGKSEVGKLLENLWTSRGLKTKYISYGKDFSTDDSSYLLATSVSSFYPRTDEDVLIVEYPSLETSNIPACLLQDANINLLISPATRGWKNTDKILSDRLKAIPGNTPIRLCLTLTQANRTAIEEFTGQLPPYTFIRQISYRFAQFALTEKMKFRFKNKKESPHTEEDDDE